VPESEIGLGYSANDRCRRRGRPSPGRIHAAIRFQYTHPDAEGWQKRLMAHIGYLQDLLKAETLRASGPIKGIPDRPAMLIISAPDRQKSDEIISEDPFAKEG
jgi:uncharacterized protein YciI